MLGTVGYMAPEQVRGQAVDARADLFALGAVLYEMLGGHRAFRRDTPAETMTAILKDDPPELAAARADLSPALDRIVRHCLEKSPDDRFQTARDVAFALESLSGSGPAAGSEAVAAAATPSRPMRERLAWAAIAAVLTGSPDVAAARGTIPTPPHPFTAPHRAALLLPAGVTLPLDVAPADRLAISPDGTRLAFVGVSAGRSRMLWLQSLNEESARLVEGSEGASAPFWSPDGRIVAFRLGEPDDEVRHRRGPRRPSRSARCTVGVVGQGPVGRRHDCHVVRLEPGQRASRVSPQGGAPTDLSTPVAGVKEFHVYPSLLPGGRHVLVGSGRTAIRRRMASM